MNRILKQKNSFALYFFAFCPLGALYPLVGQYLSSIGFSGTQVGIVTSVGTAMAVFAGMFWGKVYANVSHKRLVIEIMFIGAAIMALVSLSTKIFVIYVAIYAMMCFFQGPVHGLCDSLIMGNKGDYALIRSAGAVGYAVAVYFAGEYAESNGLDKIFVIYAAAFVISAIIIMREKEPPYYKTEQKTIGASELFKNKKYIQLLICAFFIMGTNVGNSTYFGYLFRESGGSVAGIGLAFLLMAGCEAPFMFLIPTINKKISSEKLLMFAVGVCVIRFAFYATGPDWKMLIATFFLQGISNGILLVELVKYFGKIVEPRLSSIAVSTYYAIGNNLSVIVCSLIGGMVLDAFSARGVYVFFAIWNLIALVLYIVMGLYKKS